MPTIREIDSQWEVYRSFEETKRWDVVGDGVSIGQIWRAKRFSDGVICWMIKPASIGWSMPSSAVTAGYQRTTKKRAIQEIVDWHTNARFNHTSGDWTLHCYRVWNAIDYRLSNEQERSYFAVHSRDKTSKWISLSYIDAECKNRGMMGTPGWHATSRRGNRTVIVHQAQTAEEALDTLISAISEPPSPDDIKSKYAISSLPVERHFGTLAMGMTP